MNILEYGKKISDSREAFKSKPRMAKNYPNIAAHPYIWWAQGTAGLTAPDIRYLGKFASKSLELKLDGLTL